MAKVIVCGGREFDDWRLLDETLRNSLEPNDVLIQGGAKGADFLSRAWARAHGFEMREYPADWQAYGKRAGCIRNKEMLDKENPVAVIAFPGGRGTADMIRQARNASVPVHEILGGD